MCVGWRWGVGTKVDIPREAEAGLLHNFPNLYQRKTLLLELPEGMDA